ncbi:MAG: response regulator transcription factor, partial [Actinobacteria bacterium]|nr:response regulator transcription factor [Actinomycetota bacterium]
EREAQIVGFMAKGRTRGFISTALYLSENTVRNHMRNIYQKIGVHNKQELINLIERQ